MSSPFTYGEPSPRTMPGATADDDDDHISDIPRRLMRVKVLYTFDDQNKTYCLARLPNALNIPAVVVDEDTQVGVIELRTCIEAIVAASPELVARLGHDYTVYAYDYSEYETPLVGQGMLSWILASASATPNVPAGQSQTMVTGKVCKNILGLFNNGVKETLEVKLKLVPVPTFLQSEYLESMERYRSLSRAFPEGFDHSSWTAFLKSNPDFNAIAAQITAGPQGNALQRTGSGGVESLHQLLTQNMAPNESRRGSQYAYSAPGQSHQGSRAASPAPSFRSSHALQQVTQDQSRPVSRASHTSDRHMTNQQQQQPPQQQYLQQQPSNPQPPFNQQQPYESNTSQEAENEEGPPRKRARVVQTDWRGKSNFGPRADSLRITASTAASIRSHKPATSGSAPAGSNSLEPPPRAPTPVPHERPQPRGRPSISGSSLRHQASNESVGIYVSPYAQRPLYSESVAASEDEQMADAEDSPADFPSSPPIYTQNNESPMAASSPGLPTLPFQDDSGFMSGSMTGHDDYLDLNNANKTGPIGQPANPPLPPPPSDQIWQMEVPGPAELLPRTVKPPPLHYKHQRRAEEAAANANNNNNSDAEARSSPKPETRGRKRNSTKPPPPQATQHRLAPMAAPSPQPLPQPTPQPTQASPPAPVYPPQLHQPQSLPATSPPFMPNIVATTEICGPTSSVATKAPKKAAPPKTKKFSRSNTWSATTPQEIQSEEPPGLAPESRSASPRPRSGAGAKRKKLIEERLLESIEEGKMPDFCACCGQIQTPTWRKAFVKTVEGVPENIPVSLEEPGAIIGYEVVEPRPDETDFVPKYRLFKKSLTNEDKANKEYATMLLCNPCGLYFAKAGKMRPREKWEPKKCQEPKKRGRPRRRKTTDLQAAPTSDFAMEPPSATFTDAMSSALYTDQALPSDAMECASQEETQQLQVSQQQNVPYTNPQKEDSNLNVSQNWDDAGANAALARAIRSSPAKLLGSQESPINLDEDIISPKPTRRLLFPSPRKEGQTKSLEDGSKDYPNTGKRSIPSVQEPASAENVENAEDKENVPPADEDDDGLGCLFGDDETIENIATHETPKSGKSARFVDLLKTPTSKSKRNALTPKDGNHNAADPFGLNLTSPKNPMTPLTASLNAMFGTNKTPKSAGAISREWFSSPGASKLLDFSDFDFGMESEGMQFSSSPAGMRDAFNFNLYEDPMAGSSSFWDTTSIFNGSDPVQGNNAKSDSGNENETPKDGDAAVELAGIIDEVTKGGAQGTQGTTRSEAETESEEVSLINMPSVSAA